MILRGVLSVISNWIHGHLFWTDIRNNDVIKRKRSRRRKMKRKRSRRRKMRRRMSRRRMSRRRKMRRRMSRRRKVKKTAVTQTADLLI